MAEKQQYKHPGMFLPGPVIDDLLPVRPIDGDVWVYRYDLVTKSGKETGLLASHAFDLPATFANKDFHFQHTGFHDRND